MVLNLYEEKGGVRIRSSDEGSVDVVNKWFSEQNKKKTNKEYDEAAIRKEILNDLEGKLEIIKKVVGDGRSLKEEVDMGYIYNQIKSLAELDYSSHLKNLGLYSCDDQDIKSHEIGVMSDAIIIGKSLGRPIEEIMVLGLGGYGHDISKYTPEISVLVNQKRILTDDEYAIIKKHPGKSVQILRSSIDILLERGHLNKNSRGWIDDFVDNHHENYDGSGYKHLKGYGIPIWGRIAKLCDSVNASRDKKRKSYKTPLDVPKAMIDLAMGSNTDYDPQLVSKVLGGFKETDFFKDVFVKHLFESETYQVPIANTTRYLLQRGGLSRTSVQSKEGVFVDDPVSYTIDFMKKQKRLARLEYHIDRPTFNVLKRELFKGTSVDVGVVESWVCGVMRDVGRRVYNSFNHFELNGDIEVSEPKKIDTYKGRIPKPTISVGYGKGSMGCNLILGDRKVA